MIEPIRGQRLDLLAMSPALHEAVLAGDRARVGALLDVRVPEELPEARFAQLWLARLRDEPALAPWLSRALVLRDERRMVGYAGFHSAPAPKYLDEYLPGGVELGYAVFACHRRRGYARESVAALMDWARRTHPALAGFVASIAPDNAPSLALARGLGFEQIGEYDDPEDGLEHVYGLRLAERAS